jgi:integrase
MQNPIILGKREPTKIRIHKKTGKKVGGGMGQICRVLRPAEFLAMRSIMAKMSKKDDLTNFDMCLLLGARYEEARRIQAHPEWYDGTSFVEIQEHKTKRVATKRWIRLSSKGKTLLPYFYDVDRRLPTRQSWDIKLKRYASLAGIGDTGVSSRMLRKTWESWLNFYYPGKEVIIAQSQGHTVLTAITAYVNLPFTEDDIRMMKDWVEGWLS